MCCIEFFLKNRNLEESQNVCYTEFQCYVLSLGYKLRFYTFSNKVFKARILDSLNTKVGKIYFWKLTDFRVLQALMIKSQVGLGILYESFTSF
jgi:hypothetical protein